MNGYIITIIGLIAVIAVLLAVVGLLAGELVSTGHSLTGYRWSYRRAYVASGRGDFEAARRDDTRAGAA